MKKGLLVLCAFLLFAVVTKAQSYFITYNGDTVTADTVYAHPLNVDTNYVYSALVFHNSSTLGSNIKVLRNEISMLDGTSSSFRWSSEYYNDTVNESLDYVYIPSGGSSTDSAFVARYNLNGGVGASIIEYTFFNQDIPDSSINVFVVFDSSPLDINDLIFKDVTISDIYPNPATKNISIDYRIPSSIKNSKLILFDLYGNIVLEKCLEINSSKLETDITGLQSGIYFYTILLDNRMYSARKLIIN